MADAGRWDVGRVGRSLRGLALGATEDDPGVADVLASRSLQTALPRYADEHHEPITDVEAEAKRHLQDLVASHPDRAPAPWARFRAWLHPPHPVLADRLDALGDAPVVEEDLLDEALRVGQQWVCLLYTSG